MSSSPLLRLIYQTLALTLISSLAGPLLANSLVRREVSERNPTGVKIAYSLGWLNKDTGNFGGQFLITEEKPSNTLQFSIVFFFKDKDTSITEYWGDYKVTHYQSGAQHLQPGRPNSNGERKYQFNGIYNIATNNSSPEFAYPDALVLLKGYNYNETRSEFLQNEVDINKSQVGLQQLPTQEYARAQSVSQKGIAPTSSPAATSPASAGSKPSNIPIILGAALAGIVVLGVTAFLLVGKSNNGPKNAVEKRGVQNHLTRQSSHRGQVEHQPIHAHVEQANLTMVVGADYSPEEQQRTNGEYYDGSGYVMLDTAAEPSQRQMSLVMHYALPPGQEYKGEEIEGDDYGLHQQLIHGGSIDGNYMASHVTEDAYINEYNNTQQVNQHPPTTPNVDFFLAEEVIDGTEMTQAVPIDHAYVENAIGYHQAQIEHRIRLDERNTDSFPPLSPMLTLTGASGEEMFIDHNDYSIYEAEGYPKGPNEGSPRALARKGSKSSLTGSYL